MAFRCPQDLLNEIQERANRESRSTSEIVCRLLAQAVDDRGLLQVQEQVEGIEATVSDIALFMTEMSNAVNELGNQLRHGFEATLLNLAPEQDSNELRAWLERRFPPLLNGEVG